MRKSWIGIIILIAVLLLAGLYLTGGPAEQAGPDGQQPAPHAIDQTPTQ